jgi:SAM-dependent methyltransferase
MTTTTDATATPPEWKRWMTDYNEGLGLVYERFVLNDLLGRLRLRYNVANVLEAPIYGMAGVSGINSVALARSGCGVTLVDVDAGRLDDIDRVWGELGLKPSLLEQASLARLPFDDRSFDLVWNHAALWHVGDDAEVLLGEMARVARRAVLVAMPNHWQVGYQIRKRLVDPAFFRTVDERWVDMGRIKRILRQAGLRLADEGVVDVPPWPDTVMPAAEFLQRLGIKSRNVQGRFQGSSWQWSTMDYYCGKNPGLYDKVMRYAFLEHLHLPWPVKAVWAHHRYVVAEVAEPINGNRKGT